MKIKLYPKTNGTEEDRGFSYEEIRNGTWSLFLDVTCDCGKEQSYANLKSGCCIKCGKGLFN